MTVSELKSEYLKRHPNGHYFDRDTLKFFGESISNMRVLKETVKIIDSLGKEHEAYVLSKYQKSHPLGPKRVYSYFDTETFDYIT